jgi:outer membrane protein assembly factor BamB
MPGFLRVGPGAFLSLLSTVLHGQVVTAQYDNARTGSYTAESTLTPGTVSPATFGKTGVLKVDGDVYAQVLHLRSVQILGKATHSVVFVATEHNSVYAFDAAGGEPLWRVNLSNAAGGATPPSMRDVQCPFIRPEVGITSTPVIDTTTGTIFVLARTREAGRYVQRLHALDVATGAPRHAAVEISAFVQGTGAGSDHGVVAFDALRENPRAALLLVNGRVILSWASSCDVGPYHGWVMAYDSKTLAQVAVFNTTPDGSDGGIWQGDAGLAADERGRIYAITGNGTFSATHANGRDYGDTMLQLTLGPTSFSVTDYFTPFDQKRLDERDGDLGSGAPLLLPDQPGAHRRLVFFGGKGGGVYLLDRDHLGKFDSTGNHAAVQTMEAPGMVMGASAYWNGRVFTLWSNDVIKTFSLSNGRVGDAPTSKGSHVFTDPGATPTVSANGTRGGIVWVVETKTWNGSDRPAVLRAYDASDVSREIYTSEANASRDRAGTAVRFTMPTVVGGRVYVGAKGEVDVYGILDKRR